MGVVHDLLAHVDRRAVLLQYALDDLDGPLHSGAERPRAGQQRPGAARPPRPSGPAPARPRAASGARPARRSGRRAAAAAGPGCRRQRGARPAAGRWPPGPAAADSRSADERAAGREPLPLGPVHQVIDGDDPARTARSPARRSSPASSGADGRVPGAGAVTDLGADDEVTGVQIGGQAAAGAGDGQGAGTGVPGRPRPPRGALGPVPGGLDLPVGSTCAAAVSPRRTALASSRSGAATSRPGTGPRAGGWPAPAMSGWPSPGHDRGPHSVPPVRWPPGSGRAR